jgi:hypothetical protein
LFNATRPHNRVLVCLSVHFFIWYYNLCRNLSFGLVTKVKGLQGCGPRGSPGVTSHTPGSVGKCEGVNLHTPKATPILGDGVLVDSQNFRERFQGSKFNGLWRSLYHWKALGTYMSKMGSHCSFGYLKHKLWPKEGSGVKLPEKVRNRPNLLSCKQRATYCWKALDESYNFALDCTLIRGLIAKLWGFKVARVPAGAISGLPPESPRREKSFGCRPHGEVQSIL